MSASDLLVKYVLFARFVAALAGHFVQIVVILVVASSSLGWTVGLEPSEQPARAEPDAFRDTSHAPHNQRSAINVLCLVVVSGFEPRCCVYARMYVRGSHNTPSDQEKMRASFASFCPTRTSGFEPLPQYQSLLFGYAAICESTALEFASTNI